jgi:hypothetical protein
MVYNNPASTSADATSRELTEIRRQMEPEEAARFDIQLDNEQRKMLAIARQAVTLQAIPIGNPDPAPKRQYQKRKIHGKADARGLTGAEITQKELKAREALASRERTIITPEENVDEGVIVPNTPPGVVGESQGGTSITLAIRTPEALRRAAPTPTMFRLFPEEPSAPPASTAPPRLATEEGRGKRKRAHTRKYQQAVEDGDLDQSQ